MERRERKLHVGFDTGRDLDTEVLGRRDDLLKQRALSHARVTTNHEHATVSATYPVEQLVERTTLARAPDQLRWRRGRSEVDPTVDAADRSPGPDSRAIVRLDPRPVGIAGTRRDTGFLRVPSTCTNRDTATMTNSHLHIERRSPRYWQVTFDHPPINTITADTMAELSALVGRIETDPDLRVVVFASANPDFFLAHYDLEGDPTRTFGVQPGPTGLHPWLDLTVRLSRAPAVSIAAIRGRARGAGSEFVLACDLRFASRENTVLGQFEVGTGVVPGGGPMARLSRLVGRGRALEILLVADDLDGPRAEQYGYVNRLVADADLDDEVDGIAMRLAQFDREAIARTKSHVNAVTLPSNAELPPALDDFVASLQRPGTQARYANLAAMGLNVDGDLERRLGARIVEA